VDIHPMIMPHQFPRHLITPRRIPSVLSGARYCSVSMPMASRSQSLTFDFGIFRVLSSIKSRFARFLRLVR
jgi:hypothetical protein